MIFSNITMTMVLSQRIAMLPNLLPAMVVNPIAQSCAQQQPDQRILFMDD
jgi:hypothetical protein